MAVEKRGNQWDCEGDDLLVGVFDTCLDVFGDGRQGENSIPERLQRRSVGHQLLSRHVRQIINQRRISNVHPRELRAKKWILYLDGWRTTFFIHAYKKEKERK